MSDVQVPDRRLLLAQRIPPEGREIRNASDLEYVTYRDRYYGMMRHHMSGIERKDAGGGWRTVSGYIPFTRSTSHYNQSLAVTLAHQDVRALKRTAFLPYGLWMNEENYEYRRSYGYGVVRVELRPDPVSILRPDGFIDGDTILSVTYTPLAWKAPRSEDGQAPRSGPTIEVLPPTSLAMLRESAYFAEDVWEAAERRGTPWDLARGE